MSIKYTHIFDMFEKIVCLLISLSMAIAIGYFTIVSSNIDLWVSLVISAITCVGGRFLLIKLLRPVSTICYLFCFCGIFVSYSDARKLSFLIDGSMNGQWYTLKEAKNIPFRQRKELLYQLAESLSSVKFDRDKISNNSGQSKTQEHKQNQNKSVQIDNYPYPEEYIRACKLLELHYTFTDAELKSKYHELMKQYHPDLYSNSASEMNNRRASPAVSLTFMFYSDTGTAQVFAGHTM
jgi:hypothetical protein